MSLDLDLVSCIKVMKAKWLDYYQNIPTIYLLGITCEPHCKLDYLYDCLKTYYKCLTLTFDVPALVRDVNKLFYSLYDEYAKFYGLFLNINININIDQDVLSA